MTEFQQGYRPAPSSDRIRDLEAETERLREQIRRADVLAAAVRFGLTTDTGTVKRAWFYYKTGRDEPVGSYTFRQLDAALSNVT